MKKILLSTVALIGLTVTAAAADLPSRKAPAMVAPVPVFTWTGFYVGVNAGYGWGNDNNDAVDPLNGNFGGGGNDGGFVGGAQLGYNYQMGMFVLGAETDIQYADIGNGRGNFGVANFDNGSDNEFFGTTRAPRWLGLRPLHGLRHRRYRLCRFRTSAGRLAAASNTPSPTT